MSVPAFQELFNDVLEELSKVEMLHRRELHTRVVERMNLSEEDRAATFAGGSNIARNRVHWAFEYLRQAGATRRPQRGYGCITDFGRELLSESAGPITLQRLRETDGMKAWAARSRELARERNEMPAVEDGASGSNTERTPVEQIEIAVREVESSVASELLQRIKEESPEFLEKTVLVLLSRMGYGSSKEDLRHLGGSNDGGVDGVINQDPLGLDQVYVQAKRYSENTIGSPQIQAFVGALAGKKASRGIFITTSAFSREARKYAQDILNARLILIDGEELSRLMIRHKVGVAVERQFEVPELDENFFESI